MVVKIIIEIEKNKNRIGKTLLDLILNLSSIHLFVFINNKKTVNKIIGIVINSNIASIKVLILILAYDIKTNTEK